MRKPLRPCRHAGCTALVPGGYCDKHKRVPVRGAESKAWHRWYSLKVWTDDLRPNQLIREPFCRECLRHHRRTRATDVDHVLPHRGDWGRFTDRENLQSLCHGCHSAKTMREMRESGKF